jgi:hypothetical protein
MGYKRYIGGVAMKEFDYYGSKVLVYELEDPVEVSDDEDIGGDEPLPEEVRGWHTIVFDGKYLVNHGVENPNECRARNGLALTSNDVPLLIKAECVTLKQFANIVIDLDCNSLTYCETDISLEGVKQEASVEEVETVEVKAEPKVQHHNQRKRSK